MTQSADPKRREHFGLWMLLSFVLGVGSVLALVALIYMAAITFNTDGRLPPRQILAESELKTEREATLTRAREHKRKSTKALVERMHQRQLKDPDATMDFLVLSGGGENGAFGAGFLVGWSSLSEEAEAMPAFDGVTGVSAGSFIAPFAYLGTPTSLAKIDHFFRNPGKDWLELRGHLYFSPENMSLAKIPGLERALREAISMSFGKEIVAATTPGRLLLIQASNLDQAVPQIFDLNQTAKDSVASGDFDPMIEILLASSAIPGLFPPREIGGSLFVDGGVVGNFYSGGHASEPDLTFGGIWKREYPERPIPKTRYWVILNGNLRESPKTSGGSWPDIASRSLAVSVGSSEVVALRELYALAELTNRRGLGEVEVRWVAIEEPLKESIFPTLFDRAQMRRLSDLGRRVGADPKSWNLEAP
ncbi:MAG: patatin-like phospholipase family protein [Candidatus Binatia bacterium]|nr:patatin-like phospholipase family protein [Candidatus Binatia bacterium]MDG2010911.1 patatin-like phospholipase family protein [Candidatus Binatia bacterium]